MMDDNGFQRRLRRLAEEASPRSGSAEDVLRRGRVRRRVAAVGAGLIAIVLIGTVAGGAVLLGDQGPIDPAPGPETLKEGDLDSMTVDELAAALFKDDELEEAVPEEAGFSLRQIVRHGPDKTNHDYATVGVQMDGPVDYARTILFVHPSEEAATRMANRRSAQAEDEWAFGRARGRNAFKPLALPNALPGTQCALVYEQLLSCHAVLGRVMVLTQSGDEGPSTPQVTEEEMDAGTTLIRSFGSYLERVYPETNDRSVIRYFFEAGSRDASASGVLEVNPEEATLCYEATTENIQASHLLRNTGVVAGGRRFERKIVVTFFDPNDHEQGTQLPPGARMCFHEEQLTRLGGGLQVLIDHPEDFRVDFHRGPNDEPGLIAELRESARPRWTSLSQEPIRTHGYIFKNLRARFTRNAGDPSAGIVAVRGHIGFEAGFAGQRECRFEIYDHRDELVASATKSFLAMERGPGVLIDSMDVRGVPDRLDVSCSQQRLDDPTNRIELGPVKIEKQRGTERRFSASARFSWERDATTSAQKCTLTIFDAAGEVLKKVKHGLLSREGTAARILTIDFTAPRGKEDEVTSAEITCGPMG